MLSEGLVRVIALDEDGSSATGCRKSWVIGILGGKGGGGPLAFGPSSSGWTIYLGLSTGD